MFILKGSADACVSIMVGLACLFCGINAGAADNENPPAWESAFRTALNSGQYDTALQLLPETPNYTAMRCYVLIKLDREPEAIVAAASVLTNRNNTNLMLADAVVERLAYNAHPESAKPLVNAYLTTVQPNDTNALAFYALINFKLGDTNAFRDLADRFAEKNIQSKQLASLIYQSLVLGNYSDHLYNQALSAFDLVYKADNASRFKPEYMVQHAIILDAAGRDDDALKEIDIIEKTFSNSSALDATRKAYLADLKSTIYAAKGDSQKVREQLEVERNLASNGNQTAAQFVMQETNRLHQVEKYTNMISDAQQTEGIIRPKRRATVGIFIVISTLFACVCFLLLRRKRV